MEGVGATALTAMGNKFRGIMEAGRKVDLGNIDGIQPGVQQH